MDWGGKVGIAYIWCPFCLKEWEEEIPWKDRTMHYYYICSDCYKAGKREEELTPEFWDKLMEREEFKEKPQRTLDAWVKK